MFVILSLIFLLILDMLCVPRSNDPFHIVSYYIIWVTTSSAEAKPSMFSFQRGLKGVIFVENSVVLDVQYIQSIFSTYIGHNI